MLTISELKDNRVHLSGAIDGSQDFFELLKTLPAGAILGCEGVTRINSSGIKAWMRFFCMPEIMAKALQFEALSIPLIEQLNMFRNFLGGGKLLSLALPFRCEPCDHNFAKIFDLQAAQSFKSKDVQEACPHCGKPSRFDDLADEYFQFVGKIGNL